MRRLALGGLAGTAATAAIWLVTAVPASAGCIERECPPPPPPPPPPVCSPIGCPPPEPPVCVEPNCAPPVDTCTVYGSSGIPSIDCMWTNMDQTNPVGGAEAHADMLDGYAYNDAASAYNTAAAAVPTYCNYALPPCGVGP